MQGAGVAERVRPLIAGAAATLLAASAWATAGEARIPASAQPSVIGGTDAKISDWPWQVALLQREGRKHRHICGGTLVAPTIVVTAAHCVYIEHGSIVQPAREYRVATGRTRLSSAQGQEIDVKKIHVFNKLNGKPRYDPTTNDWDVVLLELRSPSSSPPIKIAGPGEAALSAARQDAWVTGWGTTDKRKLSGSSDKLKQAKLQINVKPRCRTIFSKYDTKLMICGGGGRPERSPCFGDSGGPLVAPIAGGGFRLLGATSFGGQRCGAAATWTLLAGEPIRSAVQSRVLAIAGLDPVGSGGSAVPPTLPPNPFTASLARLRAETWLAGGCGFRCYGARAKRCKARGEAFKCKVKRFKLTRRGDRFTLTRNLRIKERRNGAIKVKPLRKWKRTRGGPTIG